MFRQVLVALTLIAGVTIATPAIAASSHGSALSLLTDMRAQAMADARYVATVCAPQPQCRATQKFYSMMHNRAVTAFDAMIQGMIQQFKRGGDYRKSLFFHYSLDDAAVRHAMLNASLVKLKSKIEVQRTAAGGTSLSNAIDQAKDGLQQAVARLAYAYRSGNAQQRRAIVAALQTAQWDRFDTVRPIATAAN